MTPPSWLRKPSCPAVLLTLLLVWTLGLRIWYASSGLHERRFFDEKYSIPNVHAALEQGSLKPVRYAYLRLTYLPQVVVLGSIGAAVRLVQPEFSWFRGETLRPAGFLLSRSVQAILGTLSVYLTFVVGRRLFSPAAGLLAAFLVAASITHLILSAIFKPDILAVATTLLAYLWSLWAIERPRSWNYLLAGLGVGLAISSKPTAGVIAVPLALAAVALGWKDRRHGYGLIVAGVTSVLMFLVLNPYTRYLSAFALQRKRYNAIAAQKGTLGDPLATLHHELATIFRGAHGTWIGLAAIAGLLLLGYRVLRHRDEDRVRLPIAMLLIYLIAFLLLYAIVTQNVLPQNLLPLLPFTSLAAAYFLTELWRRAARRWSLLTDRRVVGIAVTALVILVSYRTHLHAYRIVTPTTEQSLFRRLAAAMPTGTQSWIRVESEGLSPPARPREPGPAWKPPSNLLTWNSTRLIDLDPEALERSDVEVFPLERTDGPDRDFYRERMSRRPDASLLVVRSSPFRAWGPDLVAITHPWQPLGAQTVELGRAARQPFEHRLAVPAQGRQLASIEFLLPTVRGKKSEPRVQIDGRRVKLRSASAGRRQRRWTTDRFPLLPGTDTRVTVRPPKAIRVRTMTLRVSRWRPPE